MFCSNESSNAAIIGCDAGPFSVLGGGSLAIVSFEDEILFLASKSILANVDCSNVTGLHVETINLARNHFANSFEFPIVADNAMICTFSILNYIEF